LKNLTARLTRAAKQAQTPCSQSTNAKKNTSRSGTNTNQRNEKDDVSNPPMKYKCSYCKKKGHKATDCYRKAKTDTENLNTANELFCVSEDATGLANSACNTIVNQSGVSTADVHHICATIPNFHHFKSGVKLASKAMTSVTAKGDVQIIFSNGKQNNRSHYRTHYMYRPCAWIFYPLPK